MAIEPVGTMTAVQVQSTVKTAPTENREVKISELDAQQSQVPVIDDTTLAVARTSEGNTDARGDNQKEPDRETLKKAVDNLNKSMPNTEAVFGIHEGTNRVTIKIVDKTTKKTIKELPPEKTLDMIERVWEMAGILVDEKR
ncbi:MAG: flagellar protein FlaG [Lachnospiraceae bacterium]|nr:flagellar protein FlaG [Lachnospiraceae bacterium]MDY5000735.1 flagellar protein FlaG [Lachnospiraceae bacterium]